MKTTLELPDDLLIEVKALAARRRITLKAMIEHSLRRVIADGTVREGPGEGILEIGENGLPRLKKRGAAITSDVVYNLITERETGHFGSPHRSQRDRER